MALHITFWGPAQLARHEGTKGFGGTGRRITKGDCTAGGLASGTVDICVTMFRVGKGFGGWLPKR